MQETQYGMRFSGITEMYGESLYSDPIFVNSMCCVNLNVASICGFNDKYFDVTGNYTGAHVENGGSISFVYTHSTNSDITIEIVNDQRIIMENGIERIIQSNYSDLTNCPNQLDAWMYYDGND